MEKLLLSATIAIGDEGTGGNNDIGGGRRLALRVGAEGKSKLGRVVVPGVGGT